MKTKIELWTVKDLFDSRENINDQPRYQRGVVWSDNKKSLLIDSMLRGIDLPKIFMHKMDAGLFEYEVADGQQRITSILKFRDNAINLRDDNILGLDLNRIQRFKVGGKTFDELPLKLRTLFDKYVLTIAIIENATNDEVRTLFGRLQLGESLKPAEKRNAILCKIGNDINTIALTHPFFKDSRIKPERFNHQDLLAHAFTLIAYNNSADLKADLIQKMYMDKSIKWTMRILQKVNKILDAVYEIDQISKVRIVKKFSFLDIFWFLYKNLHPNTKIQAISFANHYDNFETARRTHHQSPDLLLATNTSENRRLYDYINAFRFEGLRSTNYSKRASVIQKEFSKYLI
jgi:hypothetical protein